MQYIYADNFRGFTKALVPLLDVNFFVGENSTGKSSLLSLIALLSHPQFWFNLDFNSPDVHLGAWHDLVSAESRNKREFSIGFMGVSDSPAKSGGRFSTLTFMMTFEEDDGVPTLSRYRLLTPTSRSDFSFKRRKGYFSTRELHDEEKNEVWIKREFEAWISSNGPDSFDHTIPSLPADRRNILPILGGVMASVGGEKGKNGGFGPGIQTPFPPVRWIAPIRTKPRRTYDDYTIDFSPEGDHTPYLLRKLKKDARQRERIDSELDSFGRKSGLFKALSIREFGKSTTSPFSLDVHLGNAPISIDNVGYGVSQSLPVVVEMLAGKQGDWFAIQQPEVHLHPRAQAALGEVVHELASKNSCKLLVETHSDFLIDRFRLKVAESNRLRSQVLFFSRADGANKVTPIPIDDEGNYPDDQPDDFRAFFLEEQLRLLRLG